MSLNLFNNRLSRLLSGKHIPSDIADLPTSRVPAVSPEDCQTMPDVKVVRISTPPPAGPPRVYEYSPLILDDTGEYAPTSSYHVTSHDARPIGHRLPAIGVTSFAEDGYIATHVQISHANFGQFLSWQELNHLMKYALPANLRILPSTMPDNIVTVIGKLPTERQTHV